MLFKEDQLQFSIKSLLIFTTVSALALGAHAALGAKVIPVLVFCFAVAALTRAGYVAHAEGKGIPFWKSIVAVLAAMFFPPMSRCGPSENEIIVMAVVVGVCVVFSYSAVRHGHWATKVVGMLVFFPSVAFIAITAFDALRSWSNVVDYWSGP